MGEEINRKFRTSLSTEDKNDIDERTTTLHGRVKRLRLFVLEGDKEKSIKKIKIIREMLDDFGYWYLEEEINDE